MSSPERTLAQKPRVRLAMFAAALIFYAVFILRTSFSALGTRYFVLFEDAMISMRYARNFAEGFGLTWNKGEPLIEGYTNLLWTLWMSFLHKIGLPESVVSLGIMLTGVAIMLGNALVAERIARKISPSPFVAVAVLGAVLFNYPLVFWTLRGMEVGAVALALHGLLLLALSIEDEHGYGKAVGMGVLGAAAVLLRSDTALSVGLVGCYAALCSPKGKRLITLGLVGGFAGVAVVGHTLFRRSYYHEPLPNTAYLKLAHISLLARVKRGLFVTLQVLAFHLGIPLAALLSGVLGGAITRTTLDKDNRRLLLLVAFVALQLTYAIYVGGDAWEWMLYANRYTSAAMPAFIVLVTAVVAKLLARAEESELDARAILARFGGVLLGLGLLLLVLNGFAKKFPEEGIARTIVFSKKTAAGGALFLALGAGIALLRSKLGPKLAAASARLQGAGWGVAALGLAAVLWLPCHLEGLSYWASKNAAQYTDEARYARLGMILNRSTPDDFRIAVVAAGATPYFADRPTEDLLGKNDKVIAKEAPRGVFSPGHDKWDYQHSLGDQKPWLVVELADVTAEDEAYIAGLGFEKLPNEMLLRRGAPVLAPEALSSPFDTDQELIEALAKIPAGNGAAK